MIHGPLARAVHNGVCLQMCWSGGERDRAPRRRGRHGKTALAAEAAAYAKACGALAVWGTCWEGEGAPGYWPWIQVVRTLARDGGGGETVLADLSGEPKHRPASRLSIRPADMSSTLGNHGGEKTGLGRG
jgi:hypothetical protein